MNIYIKQFEDYVAEKKKLGMTSFHISWNNTEQNIDDILNGKSPVPEGTTYESFCEEFMRAVNASDMSDETVLGKYSI